MLDILTKNFYGFSVFRKVEVIHVELSCEHAKQAPIEDKPDKSRACTVSFLRQIRWKGQRRGKFTARRYHDASRKKL